MQMGIRMAMRVIAATANRGIRSVGGMGGAGLSDSGDRDEDGICEE